MNKAFVREPDQRADYCPRCGSAGEPVGREVLAVYLRPEDLGRLADVANFCPAPQCEVAYFDAFERLVAVSELARPAYPKHPHAAICACFGLTREDIERDVEEGGATRTKALLERARSPQAQCHRLAANGKPCVAHVQRYFMQCRQGTDQS